jgi:hypothetical protein
MLYIGLNHLKRNEDDHQKSNVLLFSLNVSARFFFKGEVVVKDRNDFFWFRLSVNLVKLKTKEMRRVLFYHPV